MKNVSRLLPLLSGIVTLSGCNHAPQKSNGQNSQKPNIIYIFADDLGIGDLSCYGATKVSTPNIDRLAGQGVQFTNAYATSATSTPSRFGPSPRCHFPTAPVAYPASFSISAMVTQVVSIMSSELPGAIPVFSCLQGYIPVRSPKREGVLVAEVA